MPINKLFSSEDLEIIFLHECSGIMREYIDLDPSRLNNTFFIHNFSWYVDDAKCLSLRRFLDGFASRSPAHRAFLHEKVLFLFNSHQEYLRAQWFMPDITTLLINNCFSVSEDSFAITEDVNQFKAVYNAKPLSFKRHYLLQGLSDLAFISYGEEQAKVDEFYRYFDIRSLNPKQLEWGIGVEGIVSTYNKSSCGLLLSDIEGACYASTEYLLCGLPVVSTISYGGRSEYYNPTNSIIVEADGAAIRDAIETMHRLMLNGEVDRVAIRDGAIKIQHSYRHLLASSLAKCTGLGSEKLFQYISDSIKSDNKLNTKINFWRNSVE